MKTNHTLFSMCIAALIGVATGTLTPTTTAAQAQDDESWKGVVYAASNQWGHWAYGMEPTSRILESSATGLANKSPSIIKANFGPFRTICMSDY